MLATGARLPPAAGRATLESYEGISIFYAAGPPEAPVVRRQRVAVVGGGNSAGQAAIWLARGGALVTLLHRRADLSETMSDYLIHDLDRYGVAVRDRSEIAELHGSRRPARGGDAAGRRAAAALVPVPLPRRRAVHATGSAARSRVDEDGFVLTGSAAGAESILETSVPGVFAVGDVRSGSVKRCAAAVGEGSMAVRFVHDHLARHAAVPAAAKLG